MSIWRWGTREPCPEEQRDVRIHHNLNPNQILETALFIITHRDVGPPIFFAEVERAFYIKKLYCRPENCGVNYPFCSLLEVQET